MGKHGRSITLISVIILGVILQVLFCWADTKDTPHKAVAEFAKAYFLLDSSMSDRLCNELQPAEDNDFISNYIDRISEKAKRRGFELKCMKYHLYHISTSTVSEDGNHAAIRIVCKKRLSINPLYMVVASMFDLGKTYDLDEVIDVVNEGGQWKVCGKPFSLLPVG